VDSDVDLYVDLCRGASLPRLELKDGFILISKEVISAILLWIQWSSLSLLVDRRRQFFRRWKSDSESKVGISSVESCVELLMIALSVAGERAVSGVSAKPMGLSVRARTL